jgi:hypothetical protein
LASKAFDSINREKLLETLREILDFSSLRLIRLLLSNTFLQVRIQSEYGDPIVTRSGKPVTHLIHAVLRICYERISFKTVTTNSTSSYADNVDMIFSSTAHIAEADDILTE